VLDVSAFDGVVAATTFNDLRIYSGRTLAPVTTETVWTSDPISRPLAVAGKGDLVAVAEWGGLVVHRLALDDAGEVEAKFNPEVWVERSELDFGRIPADTPVAQALVLHNGGRAPLVVAGGIAWTTAPQDGGLFGVEQIHDVIEPGGALAVEVTATVPSDEPVRGVLRLFTDDADERAFELVLRANDKGLEVGEGAPSLELADVGGQIRRLEDHAGEVILLAWFGTYCPVCVPEMADLETAIWREYKERGLVMWGLNPGRGDSPEDVRIFAEQLDLTFPLMFDDIDYWQQFERSDDAISAFPIQVLIGRDGTIRLVRRRYERQFLVDAIERALDEPR